MQMECRGSIALMLVALWLPLSAAAVAPKKLKGIPSNDLKGAKMACDPVEYAKQKSKGFDSEKCSKCKSVVDKWREKAPQVANSAASSESSIMGSATTGLSGLTAGLAGGANQSGAIGNAQTAAGSGSDAQAGRNKIATGAKTEFDQCKSEFAESCENVKLIPADKESASKVRQACIDGSSNAGDVAKDTGDSGDMMKSLGDMAKAAGDMMKSAQKQPDPQAPATSPTPDQNPVAPQVAEAPSIEKSSFDGKNPLAQSGVGFSSTGADLKMGAVSIPTSGLTGMGGGSHSATGASSMPNAAAEASSPGGASGGDSGSGAGGGGSRLLDSKAPLVAEAAKDNGYEMNGGGSRMAGLKPSKADLADIAGGAIPPADSAPLDELGNREPAANAEAAEPTEDGDSIFLRVRSKYSFLQGAGRI